jgi:hypothetical protein
MADWPNSLPCAFFAFLNTAKLRTVLVAWLFQAAWPMYAPS